MLLLYVTTMVAEEDEGEMIYVTSFEQICVYFNVSGAECNCKTFNACTFFEEATTVTISLIYRSVESKVYASISLSATLVSIVANIEEICVFFNVSGAECHCKTFNMCSFIEEATKNGTTTYLIYDSVQSKVYASISLSATLVSIVGNSLVITVSFSRVVETTKFYKMTAALAIADITFSLFEFVRIVPVLWTNVWI